MLTDTIVLQRKNDFLAFSFVGYNRHQVQVLSNKSIDIVLKEDETELNEVIITVPYGTARTRSEGVISSNIIEKSQVSNVSKALQGTVVGLQSFSSTGQQALRMRKTGS